MYRLDRTETKECGPSLASKLEKFNTFEGQRPLKASKVQSLAVIAKAGMFTKGQIALAYHKGNGQVPILVNGQHTLRMISDAGVTVTTTIDHYSYDDPLDLARLFSTFDSKMAGRTIQEIVGASRPLFSAGAVRLLPKSFLATMSTALTLADSAKSWNGRAFSGIQPDARINILESHSDEMLTVYELFPEDPRPRTGPAVAMILTLRANATKCKEFWVPILANDGLHRGTPQWMVERFLHSDDHALGSGGMRQFRECATCLCWWNSWMQGVKRSITKPSAMKNLPTVERHQSIPA